MRLCRCAYPAEAERLRQEQLSEQNERQEALIRSVQVGSHTCLLTAKIQGFPRARRAEVDPRDPGVLLLPNSCFFVVLFE